MSEAIASAPTASELLINLVKDGGRRVMYGGDPYEDDVERESSPPQAAREAALGAVPSRPRSR